MFRKACRQQCDQIGRFFKVLGDKISKKVAQIISNFSGYFEKPNSYVKTAMATSWVTFGNIWATFTPASGHTGQQLCRRSKKIS